MTAERRLQFEHEHTLQREARNWFQGRAGEINAAYRQAVDARMRGFAAQYDAMRDRRQELLIERPRTEQIAAEIAELEAVMRAHRTKPRPSIDDLDAIRQAEIAKADRILTAALQSIHGKAVRNELDTRMVWSAETQCFHIPAEAA